MYKKYFIEWEGQLSPLKKWIRENHQLIIGYVYDQKDITHRIEDKLEQLGWNSIYDDVNHWQVLTSSQAMNSKYSNEHPKTTSKSQLKSPKTDMIGRIIIEKGILKREKFFVHQKKLFNSFDLAWLNSYIDLLSEDIIHIEIDKINFNNRGDYNRIVREKVDPSKLGCYIFSTTDDNEILYIGMAGKLKTNGDYSKHSISSRLQATRTKDSITKKEINTEEYLKHLLDAIEKEKIRITLLFTKNDIPSGYLEALLLYQFYKKHKVLPLLNNSF
jgi:hypothetical protein